MNFVASSTWASQASDDCHSTMAVHKAVKGPVLYTERKAILGGL